ERNTDFIGFPGTGTIGDPFRIENFSIYGSDSTLISVTNTNVHFRIRENLLDGSSSSPSCIILLNVSNCVIEENIIFNSVNIGIILEDSTNNLIINNSIRDNGREGIFLLFSSNDNQILNNTIFNNVGNGIQLNNSQENLISNNIIYGNLGSGIFQVDSMNNTVSMNNAFENSYHGILFNGGADNIVVNNWIHKNRDGIFVIGADNVIRKNNVSFNEFVGIRVWATEDYSADNNLIERNIVHNNGHAELKFYKSNNNLIYGNLLYNVTDFGLMTIYSTNNSICNNSIFKFHILSDHARGIALQYEGNNNIFNNTISDLYTGFNLQLSDNNIISNNNFTNLETGVDCYSSINNTLINNRFWYESDQASFEVYHYGIFSQMGSMRNKILNNTFTNLTYRAICLTESSSNILSFNRLFDNNNGMYLATNSDNNSITYNIFSNSNTYGICLEENADNNIVRFNDFQDNNKISTFQAEDSGDNNLFIFNYWNDWISPDMNTDGFMDNPYPIPGFADNYDNYPLININPPLSHLLLPPEIISPKDTESFDSTIIIQWVGSIDSFDHPILYSIYISKENGEFWSLIATNITGTTFEWNITSSEYNGNNSLIKIVASCGIHTVEDISDETFTLNYPNNTSDETFPSNYPSNNSDEFLIRLLFFASLSILLLGFIFLYYYSGSKSPKPFIDYFQSDQIEFLRAIYNKVIIGLENTKTNIIPESVRTPIT
ncbi:MAG: right-handed parallel beta-helix repeat-containing protein, partial [Candidatus Kariarchaeaceae archaeon]